MKSSVNKKALTRLHIFLGSFLIASNLFAQRVDLTLVPFEKNGKWGYKNSQFKVVVDPIYEEAYPTYYARGRIKLKGKYGFIDEKGQIIIKPKYEEASDFYAGISKVTKNRKVFSIDTNGDKMKYGVSLCGAIFQYCLQIKKSPPAIYKENGKYGLYLEYQYLDEKRKLLNAIDTIPCLFDSIIQISSQDYFFKKAGKYGYYYRASHFNNTEAAINNIEFEFEDIQFFQFYHYKGYTDQYFALKKDGKWGYFGLRYYNGLKKITDHLYLSVSTLCTEYGLVEYEKDKLGWVTSSGVEYFR